MKYYVDIEVYDVENDGFAQAKYLAHGTEDVLWTDSLNHALQFIGESIAKEENL